MPITLTAGESLILNLVWFVPGSATNMGRGSTLTFNRPPAFTWLLSSFRRNKRVGTKSEDPGAHKLLCGPGVCKGLEAWVSIKFERIKWSVAPLVKNLPAMKETPVQSLVWEDPLETGRATTPVFLGFPGGSDGKEFTCGVRDLDCDPWIRKIPWRGNNCPTPGFSPGEFHG